MVLIAMVHDGYLIVVLVLCYRLEGLLNVSAEVTTGRWYRILCQRPCCSILAGNVVPHVKRNTDSTFPLVLRI